MDAEGKVVSEGVWPRGEPADDETRGIFSDSFMKKVTSEKIDLESVAESSIRFDDDELNGSVLDDALSRGADAKSNESFRRCRRDSGSLPMPSDHHKATEALDTRVGRVEDKLDDVLGLLQKLVRDS